MTEIDNNKHVEFIRRLINKSIDMGFKESEAYFEEDYSVGIQVLHGEVSSYESSQVNGVSFRGKIDAHMGYAHSESFTDDAIDFLLEKASANSKILEPEQPERIAAPANEYPDINDYNEALSELNYHDFESIVLDIEKSLLAFDARIKGVDHLSIGYGDSSCIIMNSKGLNCRNRSNIVSIYAGVRAVDQEVTKTGFALWVGRDLGKFDQNSFVAEAANDCLSKLGAVSVRSGKYDVVLAPRAATDLLSAFVGIFSADAIQKGFSLLDGKIGKRIASDVVTIVDEGICSQSYISNSFDSEGVPTQNKTIIRNGVLESVLHNMQSAEKEGVQSTGNGFRGGYKSSLSIWPTNFFVRPGSIADDSLIQSIENGIYITDLSGLHAGTNAISGDFSLLCEGFRIESGKINSPVDQITIAGNFYSVLENIAWVGNQLHFDPPSSSGSIGSPSLMLPQMPIAGEG